MTANSGHGFITEPHSDVRKRSAELLWRVAEEGRRCGVTLTVESLRPQETTVGVTLADVKQLLDEVNHPNCKAMIDTTAMGVSGESIWDWFREFDGEIHNLHFVDGAPMGHLAWGDGVFHLQDMLQCLNAYDYAGPIGLEITHSRYFSRPEVADAQTFCVLQRYMED